jgi:hypothetical protein
MSRKEAALFLGVCVTTLDRLGIPNTRARHRVLYMREELCKWVARNKEKTKKTEV